MGWDVHHPFQSPPKNELGALSLIEVPHTSWINRFTLTYMQFLYVCIIYLFMFLFCFVFLIRHPQGFSTFSVGDQAPGHHYDWHLRMLPPSQHPYWRLAEENPIPHSLPNPISRLFHCLTRRDKERLTASGTWLRPSTFGSQWCWQKRERHAISSSEKERLVRDRFSPGTWLPLTDATVLAYIPRASKTLELASGKRPHVGTQHTFL